MRILKGTFFCWPTKGCSIGRSPEYTLSPGGLPGISRLCCRVWRLRSFDFFLSRCGTILCFKQSIFVIT